MTENSSSAVLTNFVPRIPDSDAILAAEIANLIGFFESGKQHTEAFILIFFPNDRETSRKNCLFSTSRRSVDMITNDVQYRATQAHLEQFERALANLAAKSGNPTRLDQLEFDAVSAKASDLRAEIDEYERVREA